MKDSRLSLPPQHFRPTIDAWIGRVILPAAFLLVLGVTALNLAAARPGLMWLLLALLPTIGVVGGAYAVPIILGKIVVDRQGILANVDGLHLKLAWKEVRAAHIVVQGHEPYLMLGIGSGLYVLPLRHFAITPIWEAVQFFAPEEAVHPEAEKKYERKDANEGISPDLWMVGILRVSDHRGLSIAAVLGMAGFLTLFGIGLFTHQPGAGIYLAFSVLYMLVLTGIGTTDMDPKGVTRRTILGTSRILWDELSAVETGPFSLRIVLEGMRGQRMVMFGPPMWSGVDAVRAVHFFALQISTRRLPRRRSLFALFKISRNTRDDF
jgi:hypothetical protein